MAFNRLMAIAAAHWIERSCRKAKIEPYSPITTDKPVSLVEAAYAANAILRGDMQ